MTKAPTTYEWSKTEDQYRPAGARPKDEILKEATAFVPKIAWAPPAESRENFEATSRDLPRPAIAPRKATVRTSSPSEIPPRCGRCDRKWAKPVKIGKGVLIHVPIKGRASYIHDRKAGCNG